MRVYFAGAYGEGKTTLKNRVAEKYGLNKIPEQVRVLAAEQEISLEKLRINPDNVFTFQREVLERQFKEEKRLNDNFVSCRCLDIAVFLSFFGTPNSFSYFKNSILYKDYTKWLIESNALVFYILPHKELIINDGFRDTNIEMAYKISGAVKLLLDYEGINYIPIHTIEATERERLIFNYIESKF